MAIRIYKQTLLRLIIGAYYANNNNYIIIIVIIIIIITIINVFNLRYNKSCKTEVPGACKRINACTLIKSSVPKRTYL